MTNLRDLIRDIIYQELDFMDEMHITEYPRVEGSKWELSLEAPSVDSSALEISRENALKIIKIKEKKEEVVEIIMNTIIDHISN